MFQGKVSRMLAAKASLACRVDALGEDAEASAELGMEQRMKIEARIRQLEGGNTYKVSGTGKQAAKFEKFEFKSEVVEYKAAADNTLNASAAKRKLDETGDSETPEKKKKKKKDKVKEEEPEVKQEPVEVKQEEEEEEKPKKKKKKDKDNAEDETTTPKKAKTEDGVNGDSNGAAEDANGTNGTASAKKKKKKDKKKAEEA